MRSRFSRRRRRGAEPDAGAPIDGRWLGQIAESGILALKGELTPRSLPDVPDSFALLGLGEAEDGTAQLVAFSSRCGGDALLAGLVAVRRLARDEGFTGHAAVLSPLWRTADRRRLGLVGATPVPLRALATPGLAEGELGVEAEAPAEAALVPADRLAAQLARASERAIFDRALEGLRGLAAKHGGAVRGTSQAVELAILARRVAALRVEGGPVLETLLPGRSSARLDETNLAEALDRLEGYVRKRLNERRVRDGEEGLRGRAGERLREVAGLRFAEPWPVGGADLDVLDRVGVTEDGTPVVGAVRERMSLRALGPILDAVLALEPSLPVLLSRAEPPVRIVRPRLLLAAAETEAAVDDALAGLTLEATLFDVRGAAGARPELVARGSVVAAAPVERAAPTPSAAAPSEAAAAEGEPREPRRGTRGGRRRRGRGGSRRGAAAEAQPAPAEEPAEGSRRFEEISLFDLDDDARSQGETRSEERPSRGRRRGRRRGSRGETPSEAQSRPEGGPDARRGGDAGPADEVDDADGLPSLTPDAPEIEEDVESSYEAEDLQEEPLTPAERMRIERERRRLARVAKAGPDTPHDEEAEAVAEEPAVEAEVRLPRGRAAILAAADRDSVAAGILLAREVRNIEGLWVYPQEELMTFFRSVCTDLRENTPIYVVGFVARPARDAIQAASLYRGRLVWFDHHRWAPEDLGALREAIGASMVHVVEGAGSSLPLVLDQCTRRSRFTDKLVDLVTGRFTQHDFERWGRLWWSRLGGMTERPGDHRADIEPLLAGRPSDLAKQAARVPPPPPPDEIAWVAARDFRLVHFGAFALVVAEVPPHLNLNLAARVVRERYGATLSLGRTEGSDIFVLGSDDVAGRRAVDAGAMVDHLDAKFGWVETLPHGDHVARLRAAGLEDHPERLDELVSEIAMGRSILEG